MSAYSLYINLPRYLSEWLTSHFGNPVTFPYSSPQNAVIRTFLLRPPVDYTPECNKDKSHTAIAIPASVAKPPERYYYMTDMGKKAVAEACKDLFLRALWNDLSPLAEYPVGLNTLIRAWCESNGIELAHVEAVRQCYYRVRKDFAEKGINLRCMTRKR